MKRCKWAGVWVVAMICGGSLVATAEVEVGDSRETVFQNLGEPTGYAEVNGVEAYTFDRGRVFFREGRVVSHSIVSEQQAADQREMADRQRQERLREGEDLRDRQLEDETFAQRSARERLAYWTVFRQRYPEVDLGMEPAVAARQVEMEERERVQELEAELMREERMAELAARYAPPPAPYYGAGWPLFFGDSFFFRPRERFPVEPVPFGTGVGRSLPGAPTARQQAMPMQTFGPQPGVHSPRQKHFAHPRGHFRHHSRF